MAAEWADDWAQEREFVLEVGQRAADFARQAYDRFEVIPDAPSSITTPVDRAIQEQILQAIQKAYPNDAALAEEDTPTARQLPRHGRRCWVIDPIDGTKGFARKTGEFSIMIALTVDQEPVLGAVLEPIPERITYAVRGQGCVVIEGSGPPRSGQVRAVEKLSEAVLVQSRSRSGTEGSGLVKQLGPQRIVEIYSAGVKLAMVARGAVDLYVNNYANFNDWGICAGDILVREAGGVCVLLDGQPIQYGADPAQPRGGMIAAHPTLAEQVVHRLRTDPPVA